MNYIFITGIVLFALIAIMKIKLPQFNKIKEGCSIDTKEAAKKVVGQFKDKGYLYVGFCNECNGQRCYLLVKDDLEVVIHPTVHPEGENDTIDVFVNGQKKMSLPVIGKSSEK